MERLISLLGLVAMVAFAWLLSSHKRRLPWRVVIGGLVLQFVFALLVLKTGPGRRFFDLVGDLFRLLLSFVDSGAGFVFGPKFQEFFIAFKVLPTIIFFAALMSLLYHYGLMQRVVHAAGVVMQKTLGTSGAESMVAAANIFVGQTEAPLVVRPYVASMTSSELMAVMVAGFATVAGGVMAAYVGMGIDAGHLLTASVISAPAALLVAKVLEPETGAPKTLGRSALVVERVAVNGIDAVARGAVDGLKLALNVAAMLIVFLAMVALLNAALGGWGSLFDQSWTLEGFLGYAFCPFAWLMGIEAGDCQRAGELLGLRTVANEFIAYERLADWARSDSGAVISERTRVILTYALCGFANFGSIGVQLGGIGPLAPERQGDLARLGLRAMVGGMLACFMTACVAGILV